jgi:hypothetical protein
MRWRIQLLPPLVQHEAVYWCEDLWHTFLAWQHEAGRVIRGRWDFMPADDAPDSADKVFYDEDSDDDDEDDEMEGVPPAAVKLEAVVPDSYDEEDAMAAALQASLADEEAKYSWLRLEDVV